MSKYFDELNKVFALIQKTGDRCVVLPSTGEEPYVVMSLVEYERLALRKSEVTSLTEDQLLDKINRDIAVWKSQQESEDSEEEDSWIEAKKEPWERPDWGDFEEDFEDEDEEFAEDPYYFESVDR